MHPRSPYVRSGMATLFALALASAGAMATETKGMAAPLAQAATGPQAIGSMVIDNLGGAVTPIYGFGVEMSSPSGPLGGGGGAGKATISDVEVTRASDSLSPLLFRAGVLGAHLPAVRITIHGTGKQSPEATYALTDVIVSSFKSADGVERVSFTFKRIEISIGGSQTCFDFSTNVIC